MTLSKKLSLVFAAFAVSCVALTSAVLFTESRSSIESMIVERQLLITRKRALSIRDKLRLASEDMLNFAETLRPNPDLITLQRRTRLWELSSLFNRSFAAFSAEGDCLWIVPSHARCELPAPIEELRSSFSRSDGPTLFYKTESDGSGTGSIVLRLVAETGQEMILSGSFALNHERMLNPALDEELARWTRVALTGGDGRLAYVSPETDPKEEFFQRALQAAQQGSHGTWLGEDERGRKLIAWAPIGYGGLGVVFAWPWDRLDLASRQLMSHMWWITAAAVSAALLLGYFISRVVVRPVLELARWAEAARDNPQLTPPFPERRDELGLLSTAFSQFQAAIASRDKDLVGQRDELAELAANLEKRVAERTRELEEAQAALVDAERLAAIGQASAAISHELRNSLSSVNVGIDMLALRVKDGDETAHGVKQQVRAEVLRLLTLSDDLLSFVREPRLRRSPQDVHGLLKVSEELVAPLARRLCVSVSVEADLPPCTIDVDGARMQSVLVNLLQNGIEAAAGGESPQVVLKATLERESLILGVEDSGPGLPPELRRKLFQPFVTTKRTGVGIGLATAKRFVIAHGGTLELRKGTSGNTRFEVILPSSANPIAIDESAR